MDLDGNLRDLTFPPMLYFLPRHSRPPLSAGLATSLVRYSFPSPQVTGRDMNVIPSSYRRLL